MALYRVSALNLHISREMIEEVQRSKNLYGSGGSKMYPWGVTEGRKLFVVVSENNSHG